MTKSRISPTPVRFPPDLRDWLKAQAEGNHRSLTGEIVARLDAQFQQEQKKARRQQSTQGVRRNG